MKIGKSMAVFGVISLGLFSANAASADSWADFNYNYPGTACNIFFGNNQVAPNGGAELVNWSTTNQALVECPMPHDFDTSNVVNVAAMTVRGAVSCTLRAQERSGGEWTWNPDRREFDGAFDELIWVSATNGPDPYVATVIECWMQPGAAINSYRWNAPYSYHSL